MRIAAIGRGGFKLSLYGGDPKSDYEALVRRMNGRRVNLSAPGESLVLLKPAEYVEHGGGDVFDLDSQDAQTLQDWIKQGAEYRTRRSLKNVEIIPRRHVAKSLGDPVSLRAIAHYSDGSERDVTRWTIFQAEDNSAVEVDPVSATAAVLRRGRHIVVARYLNAVVPIEMIVPLADSKVVMDGTTPDHFIDAEILKTLAVLGLRTSPVADDATFLRRISLDLTGRLPSPREVTRFLADENPSKRSQLTDRLLGSDEFTQYWTLQLAQLLRIRSQRDDGQSALVYHAWLSDQVRDDISYKQIARDLILASGDSHSYGPANFHRSVSGPRQQAEFVSELFMGSRLRCANCHNHPLDRWTQDDYHGLAAIFAKVDRGRIVGEKPNGETIHPRTLAPAIPKIPGESLDANALQYATSSDAKNEVDPGNDGEDKRQMPPEIDRGQLADW
ncbi:MAG: DUF1549 domain-containing protein, partial [Planctomycetota bacterium]